MPSCKDITNHTSEYLDRHMPWHKRIGYWLHLLMCVHCKRYVDQLKLTISTIGRTQDATPPDVSDEQIKDISKCLQEQMAKTDRE
ncbi:MAG: hypothetical protein COB30_015000 [Ectothiorhodospiraceae bacterium]|nr:hypothetical protein [Ectothiorhodospiraceae bacterium]